MIEALEGDPEISIESFDLPSGEAESGAAVLCIHGLTSTPAELRPVAEVLSKNQFRAVGLRLPGHGQTPADLAQRSHGEWVDAVFAHYDDLARSHEAIFVVGVSLGGLLGLHLASERKLRGLAVVGVPLDFGWHRSWIPGVLKYVRPFVPKRDGADIRSLDAKLRHRSYPVLPVAAVDELTRLQKIVRRGLSRVEAPLYVAYGRHDRTADVADGQAILSRVSSTVQESRIFEDSAHIVTVDHDGPRLAEEIAGFFGRHR